MIYWNYYPKIDLHGEYTTTSYTLVHNFISDQVKLRNSYLVIIHGKGSGKLKQKVHEILKDDKRVLEFHLDPDNLGQTLVHINVR